VPMYATKIQNPMAALAIVSFLIPLIHIVVTIRIVRHLTCGLVLPKWNFSEIRLMFGFGSWAYLGSLSSLLADGLDKIILTTLLGSQSLPYYVLGQKTIRRIHTALAGQSQFLFPMLANQGERVGTVVNQIEDRYRWFVAFLSAMIYGILAMAAYPLLVALIGEEFAKTALLPFTLACLQGYFISQAIVPYYVSWSEGRGAPNAILSLLLGIFIAVTTVLLVPRFGILGASIAQLWAGLLSILWVCWVSLLGRRFSWQGTFRPLVSPSIALAIMFLGAGVANRTIHIGWICYIGTAGVIALFSGFTGIIIERLYFEKFKCLDTLMAAINIVVGYFKNRKATLSPSQIQK